MLFESASHGRLYFTVILPLHNHSAYCLLYLIGFIKKVFDNKLRSLINKIIIDNQQLFIIEMCCNIIHFLSLLSLTKLWKGIYYIDFNWCKITSALDILQLIWTSSKRFLESILCMLNMHVLYKCVLYVYVFWQDGNDFGDYFDELKYTQRPLLLVKLRLEDPKIAFEPSLESCWELIQQAFTQIIDSAHNIPRVHAHVFLTKRGLANDFCYYSIVQ